MFVETRLYYPNNWRRNVGDLVPEEDKRFNWFICSKRYMDPASGLYVADISKGTKFYEEKTGKTMMTPLDGGEIKLLIVDQRGTLLETQLKSIEKYKYQGYAMLVDCDVKNPDESFVCREVTFWFKKDILVPIKKDKVCSIIDYAKKHNEHVRAKIPGFPSADKIENMMKTQEAEVVCKELYPDLMKYMNS